MSLSKNELKDIKSLSTKKGRKAQNCLLAEGVRVLEEALRHQVHPDLVVWAPSAESDRVNRLISSFQRAGVPCEEISAKQLQGITEAKAAQPILATIPYRFRPVSQLLDQNARRVLMCDSISDPGNLGTLIRSGLAFRFDRILLTGESADPFSPKVVRSSAGSIFGVQIAKTTADEIKPMITGNEFRVIGSSVEARPDSFELNQKLAEERLILAIGSEADGLSNEIANLCSGFIRLRHVVQVESLNAAVAGSILMEKIYELEQ